MWLPFYWFRGPELLKKQPKGTHLLTCEVGLTWKTDEWEPSLSNISISLLAYSLNSTASWRVFTAILRLICISWSLNCSHLKALFIVKVITGVKVFCAVLCCARCLTFASLCAFMVWPTGHKCRSHRCHCHPVLLFRTSIVIVNQLNSLISVFNASSCWPRLWQLWKEICCMRARGHRPVKTSDFTVSPFIQYTPK